jgi:CRISPR-associated endonuclease Cas2
VQYSVFECRLLPAELNKLIRLVKPLVRAAQDTIRFYFIGAEDVTRIQVIGAVKVTEDKTFYIQ